MVQEDAYECALPRLERLAVAVDRCLDQGGSRYGLGGQHLNGDLSTVGQTADFLDDHVGQRHAAFPQGVEFVLHPGYTVGRAIFPDELVIVRPGGARLVDGAHEGDGGAVRAVDHSGLAVQEWCDSARHNLHLRPAGGEQFVQLGVALSVDRSVHDQVVLNELLEQLGFAHLLGGLHVCEIQVGIGDDADRADALDLLADQFEDRRAEVSRDAVVRLRAPQAVRQIRLAEPPVTGGEARQAAAGRESGRAGRERKLGRHIRTSRSAGGWQG